MEDIHILDLPYEVLHLILSNIDSDLSKETEVLQYCNMKGLLPHKKNHHCWSSGYYQGKIGVDTFRNLPIRLGPVSLTKLGSVSKDFYKISQTLWKPIYHLNCRKNIPYKRKYSDNTYRKKYMDYIKKIYTERLNYNYEQLTYYNRMYYIKSSNCSQYMKVIQDATMNDKLENNRFYNITNLLSYSRIHPDNIEEVNFNLQGIEQVIRYRRRCLQDVNYYKSNIPLYIKRTRYAQNKIDRIY